MTPPSLLVNPPSCAWTAPPAPGPAHPLRGRSSRAKATTTSCSTPGPTSRTSTRDLPHAPLQPRQSPPALHRADCPLRKRQRQTGQSNCPGQKVTPSSTGTSSRARHRPPSTTVPVSTTGPRARVKADVTFGLNIRTSEDTLLEANIVASAQAGDLLTIIEPNGWTKIGGINQWVRPHQGRQGRSRRRVVPGKGSGGLSVHGGNSLQSSKRSGCPIPRRPAALVVMVRPTVGKHGRRSTRPPPRNRKCLPGGDAGTPDRTGRCKDGGEEDSAWWGSGCSCRPPGGVQGFVQADLVKKT
ncbi:MAG: hypothetical protein MZV64_59160 [Ignavibacteriales bacterium]|nr:hypothetical protein [Ignavibacteriales bacterium]